jgi:4-hydroxyacetophenone monooxygenase
MDLRGRDGRSIRDVWGPENADAYLGITVSGFPNLFLTAGPGTALGHGGSQITIVE